MSHPPPSDTPRQPPSAILIVGAGVFGCEYLIYILQTLRSEPADR